METVKETLRKIEADRDNLFREVQELRAQLTQSRDDYSRILQEHSRVNQELQKLRGETAVEAKVEGALLRRNERLERESADLWDQWNAVTAERDVLQSTLAAYQEASDDIRVRLAVRVGMGKESTWKDVVAGIEAELCRLEEHVSKEGQYVFHTDEPRVLEIAKAVDTLLNDAVEDMQKVRRIEAQKHQEALKNPAAEWKAHYVELAKAIGVPQVVFGAQQDPQVDHVMNYVRTTLPASELQRHFQELKERVAQLEAVGDRTTSVLGPMVCCDSCKMQYSRGMAFCPKCGADSHKL